MAYPLEQEHKDYMDYVIEEQSNGRKPLPKDKWRDMNKEKELSTKGRIPSAMSGE